MTPLDAFLFQLFFIMFKNFSITSYYVCTNICIGTAIKYSTLSLKLCAVSSAFFVHKLLTHYTTDNIKYLNINKNKNIYIKYLYLRLYLNIDFLSLYFYYYYYIFFLRIQ